MAHGGIEGALTTRLVNSLHVEAMVLADEVRTYFDEAGRGERDRLAPIQRVAFSCESLKVTTRLMHIIAWLLTRRAIDAGEMLARAAGASERRLGRAAGTDQQTLELLPLTARQLVAASCELYGRVSRLEHDLDSPSMPPPSPARALLGRLERAF